MKKYFAGALVGVALVAIGCGDDSGGTTPCPKGVAVNQTVACTCGSQTGAQTCKADMTLTACTCAGDGGVSGSGGASGTSSAGTGGASGTQSQAGSGGASGTGKTDDDSGVTAGTGGDKTDGGTKQPPADKPPADGSQLASCMTGDDCKDGRVCYIATGASTVGYCTGSCGSNDDCKAVGDKYTCSATTVGLPGGGGGTGSCRLECTGVDDKSCPEFMSCKEGFSAAGQVFRCVYDEGDIGDGKGKLFEACGVDGDCSDGLICYGTAAALGNYSGFCTQSCKADTDCTENPKTGEVKTDCGTTAMECRLDCAGEGLGAADKKCPDGMECVAVLGGGPGGNTRRCEIPKKM